MEYKFELGLTYKVTFGDGSEMIVKFIGANPPRFEVLEGEMVGIDWLNGAKSIENIE